MTATALRPTNHLNRPLPKGWGPGEDHVYFPVFFSAPEFNVEAETDLRDEEQTFVVNLFGKTLDTLTVETLHFRPEGIVISGHDNHDKIRVVTVWLDPEGWWSDEIDVREIPVWVFEGALVVIKTGQDAWNAAVALIDSRCDSIPGLMNINPHRP